MIKTTIATFILMLSLAGYCNAESSEIKPQGSIVSGNYEIHYSLFPSTFLQPSIAANYGLTRSKYETLLNISITSKGGYGGLEAKVSGASKNLLQQQKQLQFIEIKEQSSTYYLAPVRIAGEEIIHFQIDAKLEGIEAPITAKFSSKLVAQ